NDKLRGALRLTAAVDPQAFLRRQHRAAAAEVPRWGAARAQDRAHAVSGHICLDSRSKVETHRVRRGFADLLASLGLQLVGATQFLAVIAEHEAALVDQAEGADVAVVACLEPARVIVLAAVDGDILDAAPERSVGDDV